MSSLPARSLQVSILAMCAGIAGATLTGSDGVFSFLFMTCGWSETAAVTVSRAGAWGLLVAAALVPWRRAVPALLFITVWLLVLALADMSQRPAFGELIPGGRAARYLAPVALALMLRDRATGAVLALRLGAAATFACHGLEALWLNPVFLDLLFGAVRVLFGTDLAQPMAEVILRVIGTADLLLAAAILLPRGRVATAAALWMAGWGLVTAASRTLHSGLDGIHATLERVPHGGVPLALFLCWCCHHGPDES